MKTIKLITNTGEYLIKVETKPNGTNTNKYVKVFKSGCNTPEFGTIMHENTTDKEVRSWANDRLKTFDLFPYMGLMPVEIEQLNMPFDYHVIDSIFRHLKKL